VAIEGEASKNFRQTSSFAVMPSMHFSRRAWSVVVRIASARVRSCAMMGIMTFNSSCPACAAKATVVSYPITW